MLELLAILMILAAFAPVVALALAILRPPPSPRFESRAPLDSGPVEPCWSEEIGRDGRFRYARSHCPHDLLMELDARARLLDFPVQLGGA